MTLACKYDILALYEIGFKYFVVGFGRTLTLPLTLSINRPAYKGKLVLLIGPIPDALNKLFAYTISLTRLGTDCYTCCSVNCFE